MERGEKSARSGGFGRGAWGRKGREVDARPVAVFDCRQKEAFQVRLTGRPALIACRLAPSDFHSLACAVAQSSLSTPPMLGSARKEPNV